MAEKSNDNHATSGAARSDDSDSLLGGLGDGRAPAGGGGEAVAHSRRRHVVPQLDGLDDPDLLDAKEIITGYDIPSAIRREDGIPVPLETIDARFLFRLKDISAGYHKAVLCYQISPWTHELSNSEVSLFSRLEDFSAAALEDRLAGAAIASRQLFHMATAQYDYLGFEKRDPVGTELCRSTEAIPQNTLRGSRGRRWRSTFARDKVGIIIKAAAEERAAKHRRRRVVPENPGGGGGGGSGGGVAAAGVAEERGTRYRERAAGTDRAAAIAAAATSTLRPTPESFEPASGGVLSPPGAEMQEAPVAGLLPPPSHLSDAASPPLVPPFVVTRLAVKKSGSLGASRWVIHTIRLGVQMPWTRRPPRFHSKGYTLSAPDAAWAERELARWLAAGYLWEVESAEAARMHCIFGAFETWSAGNPRLAVDYMPISSSVGSSTRRCGR